MNGKRFIVLFLGSVVIFTVALFYFQNYAYYDQTVVKKNISYSARAKRGSRKNPYVKQGDFISVTDSFLGKSSGIIREFTAPFIGIYSTKEIIESFNDWFKLF